MSFLVELTFHDLGASGCVNKAGYGEILLLGVQVPPTRAFSLLHIQKMTKDKGKRDGKVKSHTTK